MQRNSKWKKLGWRHPVWDLLRYYRSLSGKTVRLTFLQTLVRDGVILADDDDSFRVAPDDIKLLEEYLEASPAELNSSLARLRTEEQAQEHCENLGAAVGQTRTKNQDHHQSSKALVSAVSSIAQTVCESRSVQVEWNPQRRCVWCGENGLHVSARNLDGAMPGLLNPAVVWEIKEYWGTTGGGSKMSDAVYECNLVGRELREFEERVGIAVAHVVFLDGKLQWGSRKSDMVRFVDLFHQGIIDDLIIGRDVEDEWPKLLASLVDASLTIPRSRHAQGRKAAAPTLF